MAAAKICRFCRYEFPAEVHVDSPTGPEVVLFREPMRFPPGTILYETKNTRVAVLPNTSLIADDGGEGLVFKSAAEYRAQTGDNDHWNQIKSF